MQTPLIPSVLVPLTDRLTIMQPALIVLVLTLICACFDQGRPEAEPQGEAESQATLVLQRSLVAQVPTVRYISDMVAIDGDGSVPHVLVAGTFGAFVLDLGSKTVTEELAFELPYTSILPSKIVDVNGDGTSEFARFSPGWTGPTAVIRRDGSTLWANELPGRCLRPLNLRGDGTIQFLVAEANSSHVKLLNHDGSVLWEKEWKDTNFTAVSWDVDTDGQRELLYVDGEALRVCGGDGDELFATVPPGGGYVNAIEFIAWDDVLGSASVIVGAYQEDGQWFFAEGAQWFFAYAADAKTYLAKYKWEQIAPFVRAERIERDGGDLFLTIKNHMKQAFPAGFDASSLRVSISNKQGRLVFEEWLTMPEKAVAKADGAIVVLSETPLRFLVGYGDRVWEFMEP